jgi:hypothetical protein
MTAKQFGEALLAAKALFEKGNYDGGKAALSVPNMQANGVAEGYKEYAAALVAVACIFRQEANGPLATRLAKDAIAQLALAESSAGQDTKIQVTAYTMTGFIQENLFGARQQAQASYAAAVQVGGPGSQTALKALARLQGGSAVVATGVSQAGGN